MSLAAVAARADFSPESVGEWSTNSDLLVFLRDLYDDRYVMTSASGDSVEGTSRDYGDELFERGRTRFLEAAAEFARIAAENRAEPLPDDQPIRIEDVPNFAADPGFGLMAKYFVAWDGVVGWVLSDGWFFSLPLTLEALSEIECSVLLASRLYYKQALQVLRGALELSVLHLHFASNGAEYSRWREGTFKVPPFRGKDGLLAKLEGLASLSPEMAKEAGDLYRDLNGTIHSTERRLINSGLLAGQWAGLQFKRDQFEDWCLYVGRVIALAIRLSVRTIEAKEQAPSMDGIQCSVCHEVNNYDVEESDEKRVVLRCRGCRNSQTYKADYAARYGFS